MNKKISVVIAAYNEEKLLPSMLDSLEKQDYPKDAYEVILVDNGSSDKTYAIGKQHGVRVFHYTQLQGCGQSRQYGAQQATGDIVAFTDADCIVPSDWLPRINNLFEDPNIVTVSGQILPEKKTFVTNIVFTFYNIFHIINNFFGKPLVWGLNQAIRKSAFDKVGGFDLALYSSEDWDLAIRLQKRFGKKSVRYVPDLHIITSIRKQENSKIFYKYAINGVRNYFDMMILGKRKAVPIFNVR